MTPNPSCGSCSLCCKLPKIDELQKPMGKWCDKCLPGKGGCSIFGAPERPQICSEYLCVWRMTDLEPELRPDRCGFILDATHDKLMVRVLIDSHRAEAYRHGPGGRLLDKLRAKGMTLIIVAPDGTRKLLVAIDDSLRDGEAIIKRFTRKKPVDGTA